MKIGLPITGSIPPDAFVSRARFAESMGVDCIESINRPGPFDRDPLINLALLALNTERAKVGAYAMDPFMYHPVSVCRAIAEIDEMAPGRVFLGWVPGTSMALASTGFGAQAQRPLKRIREAVELSKLCLSGHIPPGAAEAQTVRNKPIPDEYKINYVGQHFQLTGTVVLPSRKVPVMMSSFSPKILQLAGEIADEVLTGWFANPGGNEYALEQIAIGATRAGRSLDDIKIHRAIHIAVWPDRQEAIDAITPISQITLLLGSEYRKRFGIKLPFEKVAGEAMDPTSEAFRYGFPKAMAALLEGSTELAREIPIETHLQMVVAGTPDECIEQLQRTVLHSRFDVLHFAPFAPPPEEENWRKSVELFMKEIVPALHVPSPA